MHKKPKNTPPKVVQDCHQFLIWLIPRLDKFPRLRRYTLGEKIEHAILDVLTLLIKASYSSNHSDKSAFLNEANTLLTLAQHLWRLSFELKAIASKSYLHGSKLIIALGSQIGAWNKFIQNKK